MIDGLKPYPKMKDSGLPWSPDVPAHWELVPNRAVLRKRKVLVGIRHSAYQLLSLTKAGVIVRDVSTGRGKFSADMGTSQEVRAGDLVFCLFDVPETPRTVGLSKYDGMITGAYTVFECRDKQAARFMEAFYIAMDDRKLLSPLYSGLRHTIPPSVFLGAKTPLPPPDEQAAIVRFLDHADRRIRRYIRAKQKLIKLLEEQKQAIIHRAVTRGLDPDVRLKPSGVEWLGDVPEHWEVVPLKRIGTVRIGLTYSPGDVCGESGTLVLRASNVRNGRVVRADDVRVSRPVPTTLRVLEGDILVCVRSGSRSLVGKSALITREFDGVSYGAFMSLLRSVDNRFYFRVLNSNLLPTVMAQFETSTINQLTQRDLRSLVVSLPPDTERAEIADFLDKETTKADQATVAAASEITLLREYRTRLIADVVTGKLDVRKAAARLPQEAEGLEPFDEAEVEGDAEESDADDTDGVPEEAEG